jgi:hypothetical protein
VYNVASSILGVNCGVGGSLTKKKPDYTFAVLTSAEFQRSLFLYCLKSY